MKCQQLHFSQPGLMRARGQPSASSPDKKIVIKHLYRATGRRTRITSVCKTMHSTCEEPLKNSASFVLCRGLCARHESVTCSSCPLCDQPMVIRLVVLGCILQVMLFFYLAFDCPSLWVSFNGTVVVEDDGNHLFVPIAAISPPNGWF